jgi:hypothetical protein
VALVKSAQFGDKTMKLELIREYQKRMDKALQPYVKAAMQTWARIYRTAS